MSRYTDADERNDNSGRTWTPPEPRGGEGLCVPCSRFVHERDCRPSSPPSGGGGWPSREAITETFRKHGLEGFDDLEAAILALFPPVAGWRLVPVEPTPEMIAAWYRVKNGFHFHDDPPPTDTSDYAAYRAMLAAAPDHIGETDEMVRDHPMKGPEDE